MNLLLDPTTNDISVSSTGELLLVSGDAEIAQRIQCNLKTFLGEWWLDTTIGVPYFSSVFVKNPDISKIRGLFLSVVAGTIGVASVTSFNAIYDNPSRTFTFNFTAKTTYDTVITGSTTI